MVVVFSLLANPLEPFTYHWFIYQSCTHGNTSNIFQRNINVNSIALLYEGIHPERKISKHVCTSDELEDNGFLVECLKSGLVSTRLRYLKLYFFVYDIKSLSK